jgi:hypothetical protein
MSTIRTRSVATGADGRSAAQHQAARIAHYAQFGDPIEERDVVSLSDPHRLELYYLPPPSSPLWIRLIQPTTGDEARIRVLRSHNTPGVLFSHLDDEGVDRVDDLTSLPDLLFLNPFQYFLRHQHINAIWVEVLNTDSYTASSARSDPADMATVTAASAGSDAASYALTASTAGDTPRYALVLRRTELTHELLCAYRRTQYDYFDRHLSGLPAAMEFTRTLHGR